VCAYTRAADQSGAQVVPVTINGVQRGSSGELAREHALNKETPPPLPPLRARSSIDLGEAHVRKTKTTVGMPLLYLLEAQKSSFSSINTIFNGL